MKLLRVLSLIFLLKAHVAQPAYLRQAQRQLDQNVPELNVYADMELSTKRGSIFCLWRKRNDILDKVATGFDEAVGRTRFAGKLNLVTETGCSRLLEADDAAELETKSREFSNGQRSLWWRRLVVDIFRGPARCRLCNADNSDPALFFADPTESAEPVSDPYDPPDVQTLLNGLAIEIGAHLSSKLQLEVDCLRYFDPSVTVNLTIANDNSTDCGN